MNNAKIKKAIACFTWRIPKHSKYQIHLLTHGYIRKSLKIIKSIIIPHEIIQLFSLYSCDDNNILNNIKTGSATSFCSDVFTYQSFKIRLRRIKFSILCRNSSNSKKKIFIH